MPRQNPLSLKVHNHLISLTGSCKKTQWDKLVVHYIHTLTLVENHCIEVQTNYPTNRDNIEKWHFDETPYSLFNPFFAFWFPWKDRCMQTDSDAKKSHEFINVPLHILPIDSKYVMEQWPKQSLVSDIYQVCHGTRVASFWQVC